MNFLDIADYAGTCAFAISGTLSATERKLDLFGATFIGFVTAIGGGTIRDLLMGNTPVTWMKNQEYFIFILISILFTFIFYKRIIKLRHTLFLFDTIGIGAFTIIGIDKALMFGISEPLSMVMGLSSAVLGGVLRDTLCNDVPLIFHKEIYATACIAGGSIYLFMVYLGVQLYFSQAVTILVIIIIRLVAIKYNLSLPKITRAQE